MKSTDLADRCFFARKSLLLKLVEARLSFLKGANVAEDLLGDLARVVAVFANARGDVRVTSDGDDLAAKLLEATDDVGRGKKSTRAT